MHVVIVNCSCVALYSPSSFEVFRQLYDSYALVAEEPLQPLLLSDHINTDVALPVSVISENLPVLRVRPYLQMVCGHLSVCVCEDDSVCVCACM